MSDEPSPPGRAATAEPAATPARLVLSRKGFDAAAGGRPSPILDDGTLVPLPIPEPEPGADGPRYQDLRADALPLGEVVRDLTNGCVRPGDRAHLDPDLRRDATPRDAAWRPAFGQVGAAQGHLRREGVGVGDLFLFFGWFRRAERRGGALRYVADAPDLHVLFGWLRVGAVHDLTGGTGAPAWARGHPHARHRYVRYGGRNVLYEAAHGLGMPDALGVGAPGAGVFPRVAPGVVLTADGGRLGRSVWRLPRAFLPDPAAPGLSFHRDPRRWAPDPDDPGVVRLAVSPRGQEFVVDVAAHPGALTWAGGLIVRHGGGTLLGIPSWT